MVAAYYEPQTGQGMRAFRILLVVFLTLAGFLHRGASGFSFGVTVGLSASPEQGFALPSQHLGEIGLAVKLFDAQVVFRFRGEEDRRNERLQFLAREFIAVGAALNASLLRRV